MRTSGVRTWPAATVVMPFQCYFFIGWRRRSGTDGPVAEAGCGPQRRRPVAVAMHYRGVADEREHVRRRPACLPASRVEGVEVLRGPSR